VYESESSQGTASSSVSRISSPRPVDRSRRSGDKTGDAWTTFTLAFGHGQRIDSLAVSPAAPTGSDMTPHTSERAAARRLALGAALILSALLPSGCGGSDGGGFKKAVAPHVGARFAAASSEESGKPPPYAASGRVVADSGFRPAVDGFGFENYSSGYQDLTPAEVEDLFGPEACASGQGDTCVLTPPAEKLLSVENASMETGGHCFGFSVTSLMMFQGLLDPFDYGGPVTVALPRDSIKLQKRIAESFALQDVKRFRDEGLVGPPNAILNFLIKRLRTPRKENYTLAIMKRNHSVGHAVTPYAVEDTGNGQAAVLIYDNNYPILPRAVMFDRRKNSWRYEAAANPSEPSQLYDGVGRKNPPILFPTSPAIRPQPCNFCATSQRKQAAYNLVALGGDPVNHAHLLISDSNGNRTGYADGRLVNEIPGARVLPRLTVQNWRESPEPQYSIPNGANFSILLDGDNLSAPDTETVTVIGPGHDAVVTDITLRPGEQNRIELTQKGTRLAYRTDVGFSQSPRLELGLERPGRDLKLSVTPSAIAGGSTLTTTARPRNRRLTVDAGEVRNDTRYALDVTQIKPSGKPVYRRKVVRLSGGTTTQLPYKK